MKKILLMLSSVFIVLSGCTNDKQTSNKYDRTKVINELIGDESYASAFGRLPDNTAPEDLRIKTHLAYVEQLLRAKPTHHLTATEQANRNKILDHLHEYMLAGDFPKNYDIAGERRPCFLDKDGNICAVGYLVEQTESLALACKINSEYKYDWVSDMDMPELNDWVAQSGLTKEECMLIQPSYNYKIPGYDYEYPLVKHDEIGIPISTLLMLNSIALTSINIHQSYRGRSSNLAPILGLSIGGTSTAFGILCAIDDRGSSHAGDILPILNIATGTACLIGTSVNMLWGDKFDPNDKISIAPVGFRAPDRKYIPGIGFTYRL